MAVSVSYKGNVIATVTNTEKTLTTSGKYMEADVVLSPAYIATITSTGANATCYVTINNSSPHLYKAGTYPFSPGDNMTLFVYYGESRNQIVIDDTTVVSTSNGDSATYNYTLPSNDITITFTMQRVTSKITVTSNNSGSSPNLQAKTNISPTTSSQTITADSGYDGLSSVQINAMPTMTLPTSASSSSSGTSKATISRSTSNQYINIPTGYNGTASYYTISATPNMTLPTSASSSSSGTSKATITPGTSAKYINIPTGYNGTASYYTISGVTYSTIRTGTSTPASSLGVNGDIYIKTS